MVRFLRSYGLIALMVLVVSLMHYNTAMHIHAAHGIYRRLYYFPIIIAAFHGGRTAGVLDVSTRSDALLRATLRLDRGLACVSLWYGTLTRYAGT